MTATTNPGTPLGTSHGTAPGSASGTTPYGTLPPASPLPQRRPVSLPRLAQMRQAGEKIAMLTAYDATFAAVADAAGVECILVGDSLGMVCQGLPSTVGVTLDTMAYHTASVARGLHRVQGTAWLIADLPYGTYAESREQALRSACALMQAGAHMVKLEGGGWTAATVEFLVQRGVPVCAHLGLTACWAARTTPPARCAGTPTHCRTRALRCWCWRWCPQRWRPTSRPSWRSATPSASGPATAPRGRCWCCTTCWA